MNLTRIESNIPSNILRIELFLSDYCNYKCWYCSDEFNSKTVTWPALDPLLDNFTHLLDYYKQNGKSKFIIHLGGGEPTLWPGLIDFIRTVKHNNDCVISLTTNASRSLRWWQDNCKFLDHVAISVHHEKADAYHIASVGDILYKNRVPMWSTVLMDPNQWDKCLSIIDILKQSKYKWSISANQIHHLNARYSKQQLQYLENKMIRNNSLFYELFVNSHRPKYPKPTIYGDNSSKKVPEHWLLLNGYNNFIGWQCNIGVDTIFINKQGDIKGSCGNHVYNKDTVYNIFSNVFQQEFKPKIIPIVCETARCICQPEVNCSKIKQ